MKHKTYDLQNLNTYDRVFRVGLSAFLIALVMFPPGDTLGAFAVLALASVYPAFGAITGFDPLRAVLTKAITAAEHAYPRGGIHRSYRRQPANANQG